MKYFIALAGLTTAVSAAAVPTVVATCARDNCLRNVIASNLATRYGFNDCVSYLLTTLIPSPTYATNTEYTLQTVLAAPKTITVTENFTTPPPIKKRAIRYIQVDGAEFQEAKKIKRDDPGIEIITNTPPPYIIQSCTDMGTKLATDRYASACFCVGAVRVTSHAAQPTITNVVTSPSPGTSTVSTPTISETAYRLKVSVFSGPAAAIGKALTTTLHAGVTGTLFAAIATDIPASPTLIIYPNGKTTFDGKLVTARKSTTYTDVVFPEVIPDTETLPADRLAVSCKINLDYSVTCKSPSVSGGTEDMTRMFVTGSAGTYSLRLVKIGAPNPDTNFYPIVLKALPPT
ncbi:hypothetical protein TWF718_010143 [Orbilia javanica]|uniref:Uncharacterized protein n=1 Tax=Orbilia javanica TaxID=47235 RepID=A0AAN8MTW0_9PEZI